MAQLDGLAATRDLRVQARDALLQLMRGKRSDILAQHNVRKFLARLKIVGIHGSGPGFRDRRFQD